PLRRARAESKGAHAAKTLAAHTNIQTEKFPSAKAGISYPSTRQRAAGIVSVRRSAYFSPQKGWLAKQFGNFPEHCALLTFLRDKSRAPFRTERNRRGGIPVIRLPAACPAARRRTTGLRWWNRHRGRTGVR